MRSDCGGEYDLRAFHAYYKQHGISRQFTTRYTSQQNGATKRKRRKIMNMERSKLKGRNLSNEYLTEEVTCTAYLINKFPTMIMMKKVPKEAWLGIS